MDPTISFLLFYPCRAPSLFSRISSFSTFLLHLLYPQASLAKSYYTRAITKKKIISPTFEYLKCSGQSFIFHTIRITNHPVVVHRQVSNNSQTTYPSHRYFTAKKQSFIRLPYRTHVAREREISKRRALRAINRCKGKQKTESISNTHQTKCSSPPPSSRSSPPFHPWSPPSSPTSPPPP